MPLHFDRAEYRRRLDLSLEAMAARSLDAMLLFKQESMLWLTGYDTFGYCFFQCLLLRADGRAGAVDPGARSASGAADLGDRGRPDLGRW